MLSFNYKTIKFLFLFVSISLSAQSNNEVKNQMKYKSYSYLDSINPYSKKYSTQIFDGSGFVQIGHNKKIGSIGYTTLITRDTNNKIIRILKSESEHYKKYNGKPQKSIITKITIYFDLSQQPDLAKYISKTYVSGSLVTSKTKLFNLKEDQSESLEFKDIKALLEVTEKHIK